MSKDEPFYEDFKMESKIGYKLTTHQELSKKEQEWMEKYKDKHYLDDIKVKDIKCQDKHSKLLYQKIFMTDMPETKEVIMYNNCKHTLYAAAKRQMKAAPTPQPEIADEFVEYCKNKIDEDIGEELRHFKYSYQQWYSHLNRTKQLDMDKVQKLMNNFETDMTQEEIKKYTSEDYEGICKMELQETDGKPRMVCSIPPKIKHVMGPVTWALEDLCAHKLKGYCGGKNLDEMAEMINKNLDLGFTKVVEGDGSAFDNTQDITLKRVDHYLYDSILHSIHHVPKETFKRISHLPYKTMKLKYMDATTKKLKTMLTYSILGSVFSGDCDTTLANTIRMAMYNRFVNDKSGLKYGRDYIVFSKGDDFTVMYKPYVSDEHIHNAYYKYFLPANPDPKKADSRVYGLGQVLKMLDFGGPESLKFCSLRSWYKDDNHIILTRDPKKFFTLAKYSRKFKNYTPIQQYQYLEDQATALDMSYRGIDIFDKMSKQYRKKARKIAQKYFITQKDINTIKQNIYRDYNTDKFTKYIKIRQETTPYMMEENDTEQCIYEIGYREKYYKMQENKTYWENMKAYERVRNEQLSQQSLKLINEQINAEFHGELIELFDW